MDLFLDSQFYSIGLSLCHAVLLVVQLLSHVQLFSASGTIAHHASLSFAISQSLLRLMSIESVMLSKYLILCHPLLLPSNFPSIGFFSSGSALHIRWPKYWNCSFSMSFQWIFRVDFLQEWLCCLLSLYSNFWNQEVWVLQFYSSFSNWFDWIPCNSIWICPPVFPFMQKKCWNLDGYCIQYATVLDSVKICLPVHEYRMFFP